MPRKTSMKFYVHEFGFWTTLVLYIYVLRSAFIFNEHAYDIIKNTRPASMFRDEMSLPGTNVPETEKP
jgi:hypothetical protein